MQRYKFRGKKSSVGGRGYMITISEYISQIDVPRMAERAIAED